MTPVSSSYDRLILRARPWMLGLLFSAGLLIFIGILMNKLLQGQRDNLDGLFILTAAFAGLFIVFVRQEIAIFDRTANTVVVRSASVFGTRERSRSLSALQKASVESGSGMKMDSRHSVHRTVLIFKDEPNFPLSQILETGPSAVKSAAAINAWLHRAKA